MVGMGVEGWLGGGMGGWGENEWFGLGWGLDACRWWGWVFGR